MAENSGDSSMPKTLYMVVEHFRNKDAVAVYRRFRDSGRMAPEVCCTCRVGSMKSSSAAASYGNPRKMRLKRSRRDYNSADPSKLRHKYHVATEQYGRHA